MINLEDLASSRLAKKSLIPKLTGTSDQDLYHLTTTIGIQDLEITLILEELLINAREHGKKNVQVYGGKHLGETLMTMQLRILIALVIENIIANILHHKCLFAYFMQYHYLKDCDKYFNCVVTRRKCCALIFIKY